ncbi:MAG: hypothetical protein SNJ84_03695, partial [Verrucomicrobiia bacterium]
MGDDGRLSIVKRSCPRASKEASCNRVSEINRSDPEVILSDGAISRWLMVLQGGANPGINGNHRRDFEHWNSEIQKAIHLFGGMLRPQRP